MLQIHAQARKRAVRHLEQHRDEQRAQGDIADVALGVPRHVGHLHGVHVFHERGVLRQHQEDDEEDVQVVLRQRGGLPVVKC